MPRAVATANQKAWHVVGLAVAEDTLGTRFWDRIRDGDAKAARERIRTVIETTPTPRAVG